MNPLVLVPELIDEELYLEVGRGAGGGPLPRPPVDRLRFSSPRVGGSRSPSPARVGSSLFSDSVSEAVDGSELGPVKHSGAQLGYSPQPRIHHGPQTRRYLLFHSQVPQPVTCSSPSPFPQASTLCHARVPSLLASLSQSHLTIGRTTCPPAPAPAPVAAPIGSCGVQGGGGALICGISSLVTATAAPPTPRRAEA